MRELNVLSLCDGISCGRVAFDRAKIPIKNYYASEIDKNAIKISNKNYPSIIQLGDIKNITENTISKLGNIDLIIAGTPCQSLSSVNVYLKDGEKGVNGNGKSSLFWEFVRILEIIKEQNPNVKFLLENVGSAKISDREIIDKTLGCTGKFFNSNLLSAQNRNRIYWANFNFTVPTKRKDIFMKDILENEVADKYYLSQKMYDYIMAPGSKNWQSGKLEINLDIARPLTATMHKMHRADTDNYISTEYKPQNKTNVRKLTPLECERLQTLPDNYTEGICDTNRYMCIGNAWTVDVIAHIFESLKEEL